MQRKLKIYQFLNQSIKITTTFPAYCSQLLTLKQKWCILSHNNKRTHWFIYQFSLKSKYICKLIFFPEFQAMQKAQTISSFLLFIFFSISKRKWNNIFRSSHAIILTFKKSNWHSNCPKTKNPPRKTPKRALKNQSQALSVIEHEKQAERKLTL